MAYSWRKRERERHVPIYSYVLLFCIRALVLPPWCQLAHWAEAAWFLFNVIVFALLLVQICVMYVLTRIAGRTLRCTDACITCSFSDVDAYSLFLLILCKLMLIVKLPRFMHSHARIWLLPDAATRIAQ